MSVFQNTKFISLIITIARIKVNLFSQRYLYAMTTPWFYGCLVLHVRQDKWTRFTR